MKGTLLFSLSLSPPTFVTTSGHQPPFLYRPPWPFYFSYFLWHREYVNDTPLSHPYHDS